MSKDPAVLFYTSDFISGTITMSDEQRGKYILLLCIQHQKGKLTEKDMLNICKTYDVDIWDKFVKDGEYFYNKRMKEESEKRQKYSESRRNNRVLKKLETIEANNTSLTYDEHMENENENENKDNRKRKPFKIPTISEVREYFKTNGYDPDFGETRFHYYNDADWYDSHGNKVLNWKQKMRSVWFKDEHKLKIQNNEDRLKKYREAIGS